MSELKEMLDEMVDASDQGDDETITKLVDGLDETLNKMLTAVKDETDDAKLAAVIEPLLSDLEATIDKILGRIVSELGDMLEDAVELAKKHDLPAAPLPTIWAATHEELPWVSMSLFRAVIDSMVKCGRLEWKLRPWFLVLGPNSTPAEEATNENQS